MPVCERLVESDGQRGVAEGKATKTLRVIVRDARSGKPADRRHGGQKMGPLCSGINSLRAVALKPNLSPGTTLTEQ